MATLKYFTRTSAKKNKKLSTIYCRLKHGQTDVTVKTGIQIRPEHFNNKAGGIRYKAEFTNKDETEKTLRDLQNHVYDQLVVLSEPPDKDWLEETVNKFYNPQETKFTLFSFIHDFIDKAPTRITPKTNRPVSYKQIREYERTFYYLKEFASSKKIKLDFTNVDLSFYYDFIAFLKD